MCINSLVAYYADLYAQNHISSSGERQLPSICGPQSELFYPKTAAMASRLKYNSEGRRISLKGSFTNNNFKLLLKTSQADYKKIFSIPEDDVTWGGSFSPLFSETFLTYSSVPQPVCASPISGTLLIYKLSDEINDFDKPIGIFITSNYPSFLGLKELCYFDDVFKSWGRKNIFVTQCYRHGVAEEVYYISYKKDELWTIFTSMYVEADNPENYLIYEIAILPENNEFLTENGDLINPDLGF